MVLSRILTALLTAPFFLWAVYLGSLPFTLFMLFLIFLSLWEFFQMAESGGHATQSIWGILGGMLLAFSIGVSGLRWSVPFSSQSPAMILILIIFLFVIREMFRRDKSLSMLRISMSAAGVFLTVIPLGYLMLLRDLRGSEEVLYHVGRDAVFFLVFLVWIQDTGAWVSGKLIGRTRLAAVISPKKSWEGAVIGLLLAVGVSFFLREVLWMDLFSRKEILLLSITLGILAQISDLAESLLKRCFGVKDSSSLLPGHGGVLDRFDSFLFSSPVLYFYLVMMGKGQ